MRMSGRWFEKSHHGKKTETNKSLCPETSLLGDGGSDHFVEGVVFAFAGWCNVHGGGANILLLEASLKQVRHLRLLRIIDRQYEAACALYLFSRFIIYSGIITECKLHLANLNGAVQPVQCYTAYANED